MLPSAVLLGYIALTRLGAVARPSVPNWPAGGLWTQPAHLPQGARRPGARLHGAGRRDQCMGASCTTMMAQRDLELVQAKSSVVSLHGQVFSIWRDPGPPGAPRGLNLPSNNLASHDSGEQVMHTVSTILLPIHEGSRDSGHWGLASADMPSDSTGWPSLTLPSLPTAQPAARPLQAASRCWLAASCLSRQTKWAADPPRSCGARISAQRLSCQKASYRAARCQVASTA